jgi:ribonuclease P protein component
MIGRLLQTADFQRLLSSPPLRRSAHFFLHHVKGVPTDTRPLRYRELSTGDEPKLSAPVDNSGPVRWLGCVVPKRHARRAVTRNLMKRQMRSAAQRHECTLAPGLWLVRLRQGFPVAQFSSADSQALRLAAREELDRLFAQASR